MTMPPPPAVKAPPPPKRVGPPPGASAPATPADPNRFAIQTGSVTAAQKVVIYGTGGIGKSSLAALAPKPVFLDIENSTNRLNVSRLSGLETWQDLRDCLRSPILDEYQTIVIDSLTKAEELAVAHTLDTVMTDKGAKAKSLEGYGFGKGYQHVYETFLHLLVELDRHVRAGRNVVLVCHACTARAPNPMGDDFLRYEPRLQQTKEGKASIRNRVVEWADHVLFVGYDVNTEDGKGTGAGTRTIYTKEQPTQIAKVREAQGHELADQYAYQAATDGAIWPLLLSMTGGAA